MPYVLVLALTQRRLNIFFYTKISIAGHIDHSLCLSEGRPVATSTCGAQIVHEAKIV